ncbi:MEKHLA domain-containing protein [Methylorubrum aminovorans]|uniref:MEKHLA domain-containing protein n=1 Tax=Methylorubrum aminovorans TaxID=269069 RepID=UPI003C2F2698
MSLADDPTFFALLTGSFRRLVGRPLIPEPDLGPDWLYAQAPFAVLSHNTSADPLFVYANRAAQRAFGYTWEEFVGMPSRLSAEAPERAERQRLLDAVARDGFVSDYAGIRVAKDGRRFPVTEGIVWQLVDEDGTVRGQAATFPLTA